MPTYVYRCEKCGARFERVESMSGHDRSQPTCPECHSAEVSQTFTPVGVKTSRKS